MIILIISCDTNHLRESEIAEKLKTEQTTYPRLTPFGTKMGNTIPTMAQSAVKNNIGNKDAAILFS